MIKYVKSKKLPGAYFALAIATSALAINFWAWSILSPLGAKIADDLSLSPFMLSLLLAAPVIIGSLGRIGFGVLTDKFGGKIMFTATCVLTAIPVFLLAQASDLQQFLVAATILGIGGASFVIGIPFVSAWFPPQRRGFVLGVYSMGNAGTALAGFATPQLATHFGTDLMFIIVAIALILMAVAFLVWGKNAPGWKPATESSTTRLVRAARLRLTWDLSAIYALTFGAFVALGVYLPVLLKVSYDLSLTDAAARAAGFVLLATIARPIGGWLSDKVGAKRMVRISLSSVAVLAIAVALQPTLALSTTVAYLSLAFAIGCANGAVFAILGKLAKPAVMGSITGIVGAIGGLGGFFPPLVLGLNYHFAGSYSLALVMLSITAATVLAYTHHRFRDKKLYSAIK